MEVVPYLQEHEEEEEEEKFSLIGQHLGPEKKTEKEESVCISLPWKESFEEDPFLVSKHDEIKSDIFVAWSRSSILKIPREESKMQSRANYKYSPYSQRDVSIKEVAAMLHENDNDEEVKGVFLHVIQQFLNSSYFYCPNCKARINTIVTRRAQKDQINWSNEENEEHLLLKDDNYSKIMITKPDRKDRDEEIKYFKILCLLLKSRDFYCPNCCSCISKLLSQWIQHHTSILKKQENITKRKEILQCIQTGSFEASTPSLVVVTSASTFNIPNGNVVAFTLTNLITGLFIFRHNLAGVLKKQKLKKGLGLGGMEVKQYKQILRDGLPCVFYLIGALSSFIVCGAVFPVVYAFAISKTDDSSLKLAASLGAFILCTTILVSINTHRGEYVKSVVHQVFSIGVVAFALSYLAGELFGRLVDNLGWFE